MGGPSWKDWCPPQRGHLDTEVARHRGKATCRQQKKGAICTPRGARATGTRRPAWSGSFPAAFGGTAAPGHVALGLAASGTLGGSRGCFKLLSEAALPAGTGELGRRAGGTGGRPLHVPPSAPAPRTVTGESQRPRAGLAGTWVLPHRDLQRRRRPVKGRMCSLAGPTETVGPGPFREQGPARAAGSTRPRSPVRAGGQREMAAGSAGFPSKAIALKTDRVTET